MKLAQESVDNLLHIIADFDRERGIPHDYFDLEKALQNVTVEVHDDKIYIFPQIRNKK